MALATKKAQKAQAAKRAQKALAIKRAQITSTTLPLLGKKGYFLAYKDRVEKLIGNSGILLSDLMEVGVPHSQESTNGSSTNEGVKDPSTQESSSASTAGKNATLMPAQKSVKTVFFEESAKGSSPKWGDDDDEDMNSSPRKNDEGSSDSKDGDVGNKDHNAITEGSASSSSVDTVLQHYTILSSNIRYLIISYTSTIHTIVLHTLILYLL
jgi:hypothetical protein